MVLLLCLIYLVFISLGIPDSLFGSSWPVMHIDLNVKESYATLFMILTGLSSGGMGFAAGALIRKVGTGCVTIVSILLTAVGMLICGLGHSFVVVVLGAVIMGFGAGAIDTALNNFVSLHYKTSHMNWLHAFWGIGVTVSPLIMSFFLDRGNDWQGGYRFISYIQFGLFVIALFSIPLWKKYDKRTESVKVAEPPKSKQVLKEIFTTKGLHFATTTLGCYCAMEYLIGTWGASYAVNSKFVDPAVAARWVALYYGGIMIGRVVSGFLSYKVKEKHLLTASVFISLIGIIIFALPIGEKSLVGLLIIGIGFGPFFPTSLHLIPERFGKKYSADITGIVMGIGYGIGWYISIGFGLVAPATTFDFMPYLLLGLCISMFILNIGVNVRSKKNNIDNSEMEPYLYDC